MTTIGPLSRRAFLKLAARAAALVGLGAGLDGLLSGCGDSEDTPNTIATIGVDLTTTTEPGGSTTSVQAGPVTGRHLRIGVVSAATGPQALFGRADSWWMDFARSALPEGLLCGDREFHKPIFLVKDSGSDPAAAATAAVTLVNEGKADILLCSGPGRLVAPAAGKAETLGCPCLSSFVEWRSYYSGRGGAIGTPFKWTYAYAFGLEDVAADYLAMWGQVETNKRVGFVFADDTEAASWADPTAGLPALAAAAGYEAVLPGLYALGAVDYAPLISEFVTQGCELCCGLMDPADLGSFWSQSLQMGYRPKVLTLGEIPLFPATLEAIGPSVVGLTAASLWQPDWPYTDSITGDSAQELAQDYMVRTGDQWTAAIGQYSCFEWAVDAFKRITDIDSRDALIKAVATTRLDTCMGTIDFSAPVDSVDLSQGRRPADNVCKAPVGGAQWLQGTAFDFEPRTVSNATDPALAAGPPVEPMVYGE